MQWGAYEVFSVLSGVLLILSALFIPGSSMTDRFWSFAGGAFFLGYGIYVAQQTSGTFTFPVAVFVVPVAALLYLMGSALGRSVQTEGGGRPAGQAPVAPRPTDPPSDDRPSPSQDW